MLRLKISASQDSDFRSIVNAGPQKLASVLSQLSRLSTGLTTPKAFRDLVEGVVGKEDGQSLARQLLGLIALARGTSSEISEVVDAIKTGLVAGGDWSAAELTKWDEAVGELTRLLTHERVQVTAKALALAFDFQKIFSNAEILVDLRPVFDTHRDELKGMLISHKLRLFLSTDSGLETHTIAMDEKDVQRLHQSCMDALKKAEKARTFIGSKCEIDTFIVGGEFYE